PAPGVDDRRRAELERGLAKLRSDRQRERGRRTLFGLALIALVVLSSALGWWVGADSRAEAAAQTQARPDELRQEIRDAAEHHRWIHPSREQPDAATAYRLLIELESLELDAASDTGQQLRREIAGQLLAYGDAYWDTPGGRHFAREFYAYALVFDPIQPRARERAGLSQTAAAALRERAASGAFDAYELEAVAPLLALAEPDEQERLEALVAISEQRDQLPTSVAVSIEQLLDQLDPHPVEAGSSRHATGSTGSIGLDGSAGLAGLAGLASAEPDAAIADAALVEDRSTPKPEPHPATRSPAEAAELTRDGDIAYHAGHRDDAERLYQRSLELDGKNLDALIGLHRLSFDRSDFNAALTYARRAQSLRPKRG